LRELGDEAMRLNGHLEQRLPNTLSLSFRGVEANTLLSEIGDQVAASAGAACHADQVDVSAVLQAMQGQDGHGYGALSTGGHHH
jgi:cysteine desulfurase